jgi:hypothetical protein
MYRLYCWRPTCLKRQHKKPWPIYSNSKSVLPSSFHRSLHLTYYLRLSTQVCRVPIHHPPSHRLHPNPISLYRIFFVTTGHYRSKQSGWLQIEAGMEHVGRGRSCRCFVIMNGRAVRYVQYKRGCTSDIYAYMREQTVLTQRRDGIALVKLIIHDLPEESFPSFYNQLDNLLVFPTSRVRLVRVERDSLDREYLL